RVGEADWVGRPVEWVRMPPPCRPGWWRGGGGVVVVVGWPDGVGKVVGRQSWGWRRGPGVRFCRGSGRVGEVGWVGEPFAGVRPAAAVGVVGGGGEVAGRRFLGVASWAGCAVLPRVRSCGRGGLGGGPSAGVRSVAAVVPAVGWARRGGVLVSVWVTGTGPPGRRPSVLGEAPVPGPGAGRADAEAGRGVPPRPRRRRSTRLAGAGTAVTGPGVPPAGPAACRSGGRRGQGSSKGSLMPSRAWPQGQVRSSGRVSTTFATRERMRSMLAAKKAKTSSWLTPSPTSTPASWSVTREREV